MPVIITRALVLEEGPQEVIVPKASKPVNFLNRGGTASVLFEAVAAHSDEEGLRVLQITEGAREAESGAAYIGTAEFAGGMRVMHAWEVSRGGR